MSKYFGSLVVVNSNRLIQTSNLGFGRVLRTREDDNLTRPDTIDDLTD